MVHIVKLAYAGIASREHLTIGTHSRFIQTVGVQTLGLGIHGSPPCPEGILFGEGTMRMATQRTLKDVAVGIDEAGQQRHAGEHIGQPCLGGS